MAHEREIPSLLFGSVRTTAATGGHQANKEEFRKPFEDRNSVMYAFCCGCGYSFEITRERAEDILASKGLQMPSNPSEWYIERYTCGLCDGTNPDVGLKRIDESQ